MSGSIPPKGPPAGFPSNPSGVPQSWKPVGDSPSKNGGYGVVYQTPNGKSFTVNSITNKVQKGAHWSNK